MKRHLSSPTAALLLAGSLVFAASYISAAQAADAHDGISIERGRYIARIAGCNDCHTPGYGMSGGQVPESQWLVGDEMGWKGPWGTTYPANLRLLLSKMSEDEWVQSSKRALRPPMPWFALRDMSEQDLRAFYRFVRSLGPAGKPAPAYVAPEGSPLGPVITFPAPPAAPQKAAAR